MAQAKENPPEVKTVTAPEKFAVIRQATEDDIPRILELYDELVVITTPAELGRNPAVNDYRETLARINAVPGLNLLVADYQGELLGTMVLFVMPNLSHRACSWLLIENLVVDHRFRSRQLGKALVEYALVQAKEAGCYRITLTSNKKRRRAHKFYRSLGFEASSHGFSIYL